MPCNTKHFQQQLPRGNQPSNFEDTELEWTDPHNPRWQPFGPYSTQLPHQPYNADGYLIPNASELMNQPRVGGYKYPDLENQRLRPSMPGANFHTTSQTGPNVSDRSDPVGSEFTPFIPNQTPPGLFLSRRLPMGNWGPVYHTNYLHQDTNLYAPGRQPQEQYAPATQPNQGYNSGPHRNQITFGYSQQGRSMGQSQSPGNGQQPQTIGQSYSGTRPGQTGQLQLAAHNRASSSNQSHDSTTSEAHRQPVSQPAPERYISYGHGATGSRSTAPSGDQNAANGK